MTGRMLSTPSTSFVRDILASVRSGSDGWALNRIRENPDGHLQELAKDFLQHDENKTGVNDLIEATKTMLPDELQRLMRSGKVGEEHRLEILHRMGAILMPEVLASRGINPNKARAFMKKKPLVLRFLYLKAWRSLSWLEKGGFESLPSKAVTNEEIDNQYILSATMFHSLLTLEKSENAAYQDLVGVLARKA